MSPVQITLLLRPTVAVPELLTVTTRTLEVVMAENPPWRFVAPPPETTAHGVAWYASVKVMVMSATPFSVTLATFRATQVAAATFPCQNVVTVCWRGSGCPSRY